MSLDEFVRRSRIVSDLPTMLNYYHDLILHVIHTWVPGEHVQQVELIQEIDELGGWIVQIRSKHGTIVERDIAYGCWVVWYLLFPEWALRILDQFIHGVGCWSDIKYICGFLKRPNICARISDVDKKRIIEVLLEKMVTRLYEDKQRWSEIMSKYFENRLQFFSKETPADSRQPLMPRPVARKHLSLVAKWIPRESSKHGDLFLPMVNVWATLHGHKIRDPRNERKWCRLFRKAVSTLNRELDTLEVKMCANQWEDIDPMFMTAASISTHFTVLLRRSKVFQQHVLEHPGRLVGPIIKYLTSKCRVNLTTEIVPVLDRLVDWFRTGVEYEDVFRSREILPWIARDEPVGSAAWWWAGMLAHYSSLKRIVVTCLDKDDFMFREPFAVLLWLKTQGIDVIKTDNTAQTSLAEFQHFEAFNQDMKSSSTLSICEVGVGGLTVLQPR